MVIFLIRNLWVVVGVAVVYWSMNGPNNASVSILAQNTKRAQQPFYFATTAWAALGVVAAVRGILNPFDGGRDMPPSSSTVAEFKAAFLYGGGAATAPDATCSEVLATSRRSKPKDQTMGLAPPSSWT